MQILNPKKSFHLKVKTLYDIEKELEKALPKMAEAASNPELKAGFLAHLVETKEQSLRLESIFNIIEVAPEKHAGDTIRGLVADGDALASSETPVALRDALLAGAGREVEHFEMACYMNAIEEAVSLGLEEVVELLETTLSEEVASDENLMVALKENLALAVKEVAEEKKLEKTFV